LKKHGQRKTEPSGCKDIIFETEVSIAAPTLILTRRAVADVAAAFVEKRQAAFSRT
jgi:hypothetical protein